ncbi:hypothetical protein DE146DRAFT_645684 [Phaeosphaeria sp. MPI-PUGE-AT-0046c]|nr:hypothetical protein DE146DRAFT_645684 [Phaeosphaeria sp. MPI-PUGE-AT-0046c]
MEPPPKRLRLLQSSVEVDESSPAYIAAQQKQQERFKGTLESIFAKYGSMHESQSDEIDLKGNIIVNRGHLRRAARHGTLNSSTLLDSVFGGDVSGIQDTSDSEGDKEDSEDELAPTQPIKPSSAQKQTDSNRTAPSHGAQSSPATSTPFQAQTPKPSSVPAAQIVPYTPDPAANLLQHVHFPQTPAGQQAQSSFYTALTQTINQAVQQAVAPLFSSILPFTSTPQLPSTNVLPPPITPANVVDTVTAARDPKWFFPPLPEQTHEKVTTRSQSKSRLVSSSPVLDAARQQDQLLQEDDVVQGRSGINFPEQSTVSVAALVRSQEPFDTESRKPARRSSPRVEIQNSGSRRTRRKYAFSEEEEIYITKRKALHGRTWEDIRNSKKKWEDWPTRVFQTRYERRWKHQQLHLKDTPELQECESVQGAPEVECNAVPSCHLPTPSSLEQEDSHVHVEDAVVSTKEHVFSSSTHFDDDERDLLSLAGDDLANEQLQCESAAEDAFFPDTDEIVLPSVEMTGFADEDALQQGLLEGSPPEEASTMTTIKIKEEPTFSSPITKRKRRRMNLPCQAIPDSESEANSQDDKYDYEINANTAHSRPRPDSPDLDLIGDDELQACTPTTRTIKRELSTPPPTSFLLSTPAPQPHLNKDLSSSGVKSASGLSRKAYLKKIKQSWTKTSTPAGKTVANRRSFHTEPRKRTWTVVGDSEDELGF